MGRRLAISIPDTVLEEKMSPRDKTAKLGLIARACAIYGVDVIEVFRDRRGGGEAEAIRRVLEYLETPQYLRRRLFPFDETLKFAGVLPPLRIPSHKPRVPLGRVAPGEVREGVVNPDGSVDVGLDEAPKLLDRAEPDRRVTVRISSINPLAARVIGRSEVDGYWGYSVETKGVGEVLDDPRFKVKIATSRLGTPLPQALPKLRTLLEEGSGVKLLFGSPSQGLFEMVGRDLHLKVDLVVNLFPGQQVETVRTEEALFAGLGAIGLVSAEKA
ncbi:MAG: hypothetical protein JRN45_08780 [Nitrososphaerota archaeon]|nr:hypothetical protein [Nitrososphaerota archaeon]